MLRTAKPHRRLSPKSGSLIAVRLDILTRKTLGALQTNLSGQMLELSGDQRHALERTFLGGCVFSGRVAGRSAGASV